MVWGIMKQGVAKRAPKNSKELKEAIQMEWDNLGIRKIRACIKHLKKNLKKVVINKGQR